jgi:ABC-2 type transport system permease protein
MRAALTAEFRKLVTTRLWWLLLIVMVAYLAFVAAVVALSMTALVPDGTTGPDAESAARSTYSLVNGIGYVFPLIIGSLAMTTEFRHKTITQSLLVEPNRSVFLGAKLVAIVPIGLIAGLVATVAVLAAGAPVLALAGDGSMLGSGDVLLGIALGVVVVALWAVIGVGFGSWVSNQIAAIVVILAFTQFVEPIARVALGAVDGLERVASFLPGAAADALIGGSFLGDSSSLDLLPRWAALLVMLGYAALFAVIGRLTTLRRDIG